MAPVNRVPDGWREVKLVDVAQVIGGSTPSRGKAEFWEGSIPWVVPTDLTDLSGRYLTATKETITDEGFRAAGLKLIPPYSILLTSRATVGATVMTTVAVATNQGFQNLVVKSGIDCLWLFYQVSALRKTLERRAAGSTFREVSRDSVRSLPILLPPLAEQRAIAEVLDSIDETIERTEAVIAATERLRDALLHELLTRGMPGWHTEWREESGLGTLPASWQGVRLGEVCTPPKYGASAPARPFDPTLPRYVRITDLTEDGHLSSADSCSAEPSRVAGYELEPGDLLFARSGATVGKTYMYRLSDGPCVYAGYLIRFRPLREIVLPDFLKRYAHSRFYQRWVVSVLHAGAQPNINAVEYSSLRIPLPSLLEQRSISSVLDCVDTKIECERAVRDALESHKTATSEALLAGRVRTNARPKFSSIYAII